MATPDRLERLTDLILVLLHTARPLTLDELANEIPGYPESPVARRQAFERDKRLLREEGIPITTRLISAEEQTGYFIDPEEFYLPDLRLDQEEQAALALAVAGVDLSGPTGPAGHDALLKLGSLPLADARPLAALAQSSALAPLFSAVKSHAEVTFGYRNEVRSVAPGAIWFRFGRWYLVGWDRERTAPRTFRVDRFQDLPGVGPPESGVCPDSFDPAALAPEEPWRTGEESEDDVLLAVDPIEAERVIEEVGVSTVLERKPDGSVLLRLGMSSELAMRSWILALLDHAEVMGPEGMRSSVVAWLTAMIESEPTENGARGKGRSDTGTDEEIGEREVEDTDPIEGVSKLQPLTARERLRRLLAIVSWLAQVGEAPLEELGRRFRISPEELVGELELAACCGRPPYTPDTLLEIVVTEETAQAFLPKDMARPRRLTPSEGFALVAAARTIEAVPGIGEPGALSRAIVKLDEVLGSRDGMVISLDNPRLLQDARQAVENHEQIEIEYHSGSTDETTIREVDPFTVTAIEGRWYLDGHCHRAHGMRRFRLDRIRSLRTTGRTASSPPPGLRIDSAAYVPGPGATMVTLALDSEAAWVTESVPVLSAKPRLGGGQVVTLSVNGTAWLERLLLQAGSHARVLAPAEHMETGAAAALRVLQRYRR